MGRLILGIDPGNARCGWGLVSEDVGRLELVACGCLETPKGLGSGQCLMQVYTGIQELLATYQPSCLAMEKLFFNRNITSAMGVAEARGVVLLAAAQAGVAVAEYTPSEIKETVVGTGAAKKKEVGLAVALTFGLAKPPSPDDTADAVAVAMTHSFWSELNGLE